MMHGSPVRLTPCSSALLWAEGGPAACWGSCLWKDAEASSLGLYAIFFLLVVGKLQQGGLGKD